MSLVHQQLAIVLTELEAEMRRLDLWEANPPSPAALQSTQPFAVDTLKFSQWLQFIFVARLRLMIAAGGMLPSTCSVRPMAEESFKGMDRNMSALEALIGRVDELLSGGTPDQTLH